MKFILPLPPGINATYGINSRRDGLYKRTKVKDWEYQAGWDIIRQRRGAKIHFSGAVEVRIVWYYKYDRDIDAGIKVLFDLLERQGIVDNDRQIRKVTGIEIYEDAENPRVEIEINEL